MRFMLSHNRISAIDGVRHLAKLRFLDLSHNEIATADTSALPPQVMNGPPFRRVLDAM